MSLPPLHTLEQVAEYLHLKPKSLREFCRDKGISLIKGNKRVLLLTEDDVDTIISLRRQSCSNSSHPKVSVRPTTFAAPIRLPTDVSTRLQKLRTTRKQSKSSTRSTKIS